MTVCASGIRRAVLQRHVYAPDLHCCIPAANEVVEVCRNRHGNWVLVGGLEYMVFRPDGTFAPEPRRAMKPPVLVFEHPLLQEASS